MSIVLTTLMAPLAREMGDTDSSNYYYSSDQLFSSLNDGVDDYNQDALTQQFSKSGSGDSETISPTPTASESRLIVFHSALALVRGEIAKAARVSLIHSNPAGRTDMTKMVEALEKHAERLESKIEAIKLNRGNTEVEKEIEGSAWGIELRGRISTEEAEATGILDITYTES